MSIIPKRGALELKGYLWLSNAASSVLLPHLSSQINIFLKIFAKNLPGWKRFGKKLK
jgi:hypothetical protein